MKMENIKQINIKSHTFSHNDMINKNRQKVQQKYWHLQYWLHHNKKKNDYENINSVYPLYLYIKADD